ncbi:MAG: TonB-dependent receptor [Cellvibrionaceae bacterium]|nr:TonB-dependent receptor [Cellvibrionaceae bacterium]
MPTTIHPLSLALPLTLASTLPIGNALAQQAGPIEEILVTASRMEKPVTAIPNTVSIIDRDTIKLQAAIEDSVAGILEKTVPGFAPNSQKMTGGAETLRGKNALLMIDGISQHNSLRDGLRDGFTIDSDFLERIEVVQGANAVQGIGATGGVVNLVTRVAKTEDRWGSTLKARVSGNDNFDGDGLGYKLSYIGDIKTGDIDLVIGGAWHERGIFFDGNGDRVGFRTAQGELQDSQSRDLFAKFGYAIDEAQRIQLMLNDYELENNGELVNVPGDRDAGIYASSAEGDFTGLYGKPAMNDITTVSLDYSHQNLLDGKLRAQFYHQDFAALYEGLVSRRWALTPGGAAILDQSEIQSEKLGIKLSYEMNDTAGIAGLRSMFGLDYSSDESQQVLAQTGRTWVPPMELVTISPFAQFEYQLSESLLLAAGLRYEKAALEVADFVTLPSENNTQVKGGEPDFNEPLVNIAAVYDISDSLAFYASYSEGFDMPDVGRVLRAIDVPGLTVEGIINLEPVITENTEIGFNFDSDRISAQLSLYQSITDLGSRLNEVDGIYEVRREKQEIWGFDLIASYQLSDNTNIGLNYAHIDGEYDANRDGTVDTDLGHNNQAPDRINVFASGNWGEFGAKLQLSQLLDRTQKGLAAPSDERAEFNGYTLVDLSLQYDTQVGQFGLGIQNLLDKEYETLYSQYQNRDDRYFSGRGRTISLSFDTEF